MNLVETGRLETLKALSIVATTDPPATFALLADILHTQLHTRTGFWYQDAGGWRAIDPELHKQQRLPAQLPAAISAPAQLVRSALPVLGDCLAMPAEHQQMLTFSPPFDPGELSALWQTTLHALVQAVQRNLASTLLADSIDQGQLLRAVIDELPEGVLVGVAPHGKLIMANRVAEELWGHPFIEVDSVSDYYRYNIFDINGSVRAPEESGIAKAISTGQPVLRQELLIKRPDDTMLPVLANTSPIKAENGAIIGAVVVFQDISEWKRQEHDRDNAIAAIAHDLKNPLTTIRGSAELLLRRARNDSRPERELTRLRTIIEQADRMRDFLGSLVDVARLHSGELPLMRHPLNLAELVERTVTALNSSFSRPRIIMDIQTSTPILADQIWMERVVENLLDNALKYSPVETKVFVSLVEHDTNLRLQIKDQGIGIEPSDIERIFEQFARGSNSGSITSGTGLGLYTVRAVVRAHAGRIYAESAGLNQGSIFTVELPTANAEPA